MQHSNRRQDTTVTVTNSAKLTQDSTPSLVQLCHEYAEQPAVYNCHIINNITDGLLNF